MPEAAPVFAEITASELRGSRGKVIAGIKTGAVEVGIYIRADSAAEAALCWGLRDAECPCGSRADLYCLWVCGFATLVQQKFRLAPFSGTLFLPCGYRQDWIKRLYWEEDGFALVTKRLEAGSFQWPRNSAEARRLSYQQYP